MLWYFNIRRGIKSDRKIDATTSGVRERIQGWKTENNS